MRKIIILSTILFLTTMGINGCLKQKEIAESTTSMIKKSVDHACKEHSDCLSGVCNHYKKDLGKCATESCKPGDRTDNNNFYCNEAWTWKPSKKTGEKCSYDYECYQPTCYMIPSCHVTDIPETRSYCDNGACVIRIVKNNCDEKGMKRLLKKDQYTRSEDGKCFENMAQRLLPTVCSPCGNGECDAELESVCNCPEDCA